VSGQHHAPAALYPRGKSPGTHCTGGWVGPRAGLDTEVRGKIICLCRGSNPAVQSGPIQSGNLYVAEFIFLVLFIFQAKTFILCQMFSSEAYLPSLCWYRFSMIKLVFFFVLLPVSLQLRTYSLQNHCACQWTRIHVHMCVCMDVYVCVCMYM
jgi:hypothetical protein